MQVDPTESFLNFLSLFLFISRLLSVKFEEVSLFISFMYLTVIAKLKLKSVKLKSLTFEQFEDLIIQNKYKSDFIGDLNSCALLSANTLIALCLSNKSWLRITKVGSDTKIPTKCADDNKKFEWKIRMPLVENSQSSCDFLSYCVQCLCVSNAPKDFVLYVTDVKLFNILNQLNHNNISYNSVGKVEFENVETGMLPQIAKSVSVAGILCVHDITFKDYENILNQYFVEPKCLRVGEVFKVCLKKYRNQLKANLCNVSDVYFKVITITGQPEKHEHYVLKGYTNLYLDPPVHSYLPPEQMQYVKMCQHPFGFEIPLCPDGLLNYHKKLQKILKPFLNVRNTEPKPMFLLCGAKGSGKKTTIKSVAAFFGLHLLQFNCLDFYGINPSLVQGKFDQLFAKVRRTVPCIVHLENVEFLGREQNFKENTRLIDIFETQISELWNRKSNKYPLVLIGSTHSNSSELVSAIARLFVRTITFEAPKTEEAYRTLNWLTKNSNMVCCSNDLRKIAERLNGYVFADLVLLVQHAVRFQSQAQDSHRILLPRHFDQGIEIMESAYSDSIGAARVPVVHWDDIGGLGDVKEEIMLTLNIPLKRPELFNDSLKRSGIMFYGPPGTGKTLMAKAVATECNYNFLSVKGPELMNMYVGESEKNIREVFERARDASPCIIFFDELDSLAPSRGKSSDSGGVTDRVVSQLLAEMDGLDKNKDVFVIAATNRPDLVDPALLRPGRFDKMFYIGVCSDKQSKLSILQALTRKFSLDVDVDLEKVAEEVPNQVTGADLYSLCSNAWFSAARKAVLRIEKGEEITLPLVVPSEDFSDATQQFVPSLTAEDIEYFEKLKSSESS